MALIGKIREKSTLLVIIIGIALFAFIMGDWEKSQVEAKMKLDMVQFMAKC